MASEKTKQSENPTIEKEELNDLFEVLPEDIKPVIEKLPQEEREKAAKVIISNFMMIRQTSFRGPLPPPDVLAGYESALPGSAERIFKMAENQSAHRQKIEEKVINSQMKQTERGQNYGLSIGILGLLLGTALTVLGHSTVAGILFTTTILGLVSVFVIGKILGKKETETSDPGT